MGRLPRVSKCSPIILLSDESITLSVYHFIMHNIEDLEDRYSRYTAILQYTVPTISGRKCGVGSHFSVVSYSVTYYYTKNTEIIMSGKALKSQLSDTMLNGEQLSSETDHSNFADFKPGRPESYKIEFKKSRDTLEMKGEV